MKRTNEDMNPNAWGNHSGHHAPTPGAMPTPQAGAPNATGQTPGVPGAPGVQGVLGAPHMLGYPAPYATAPGQRVAQPDLLRQLLDQ